MNLILDIGNTTVKAAIFKDKNLVQLLNSVAEVRQAVIGHKVNRCMISKTGSDHPLEDFLDAQPFRVRYFSSVTKLPFTNNYGTPDTIGADRLALVAAVAELFPKTNLLCIDTGTCITYNFVNSANEFLGGAIAPGLEMRFKSLHHFTARLPLVKWEMNKQEADTKHNTSDTGNRTSAPIMKLPELIGNTTNSSILSGVLNGMAAETDGIIYQYKKRYKQLKVVVTGGSLPFFGSALENAIFARPNLVLHGLNTILEYNS